MKDGLKIVQVAGRYGYNVTMVGWVRRTSGDELELLNARTVWRTGQWQADGLQKLAAAGPKKTYKMGDRAETAEELHRLTIRRSLVANEAEWLEHCPRPKGWGE